MKKITDYAELVKAKHALNKTIAPVEDGASMTGSYTSGQQFIRDGVLYTALTSIAASTAWSSLTLDTDYEVADDITSQLASLNQTLTNNVSDINTALTQINTDLANEAKTRSKMGAKNLLSSYPVGTRTQNGVTFVTNADGSVTVSTDANGATGNAAILVPINLKDGENYILTGCPNGGTSDSYHLVLEGYGYDYGSGYSFKADTTKGLNRNVDVYVKSGTVINPAKTFYPMLRLATDANSDYEPYSMTNQELTPIAQAVSNRNLIDNPWFTVNQRGQSSYSFSGSGYTVDRWHIQANMTLAKSDDAITISSANGGNFYQLLPISDFKAVLGKTITISVMLSDGTIKSVKKTLPTTLPSTWTNYSDAIDGTIRLGVMLHPSYFQVFVGFGAGDSISIKAIKVEIGAVSTLAQDTEPNYAEELLKCQRYFYKLQAPSADDLVIGNGYAISATNGRIKIDLPTEMRAIPTLAISNYIGLVKSSGVVGSTTGNVIMGQNKNSLTLDLISVYTVNEMVCARLDAADSLSFSADL